MAERTCHNCVYAVCDPGVWLRWIWAGESIVPRCANSPWSPGKLCDVSGVPCRNYRPKPPMPQGEHVRMIPLSDGSYAYVDAADYEWLSQWKWHLCGSGYPSRWENRRRVFMHREIMKPPRGMLVDHKDGNRANNCRFNLRNCTHAENARNRRKYSGSDSNFKGVYWDRRKHKWYINCRYKGRNHRLGYFAAGEEVTAARAYDQAAVERIGDFAKLNFPNEWPPQRKEEVRAAYEAQLAKEKAAKRKTPRAKRKTPGPRSRATRDERRATNQGKAPKRKPPNAKRTTKPPRAETPGRGGQKRKAKPKQATGGKPRGTAPKALKRKPPTARRTTKPPRAGTRGRREGKGQVVKKTGAGNPPRRHRGH